MIIVRYGDQIRQRLDHQLPGIRGVYAHATEPMQAPLLAALQDRWLDSGGHW
ncbi:hypothetical protein HC031_09230 [Planosporangium thailandense]|uniref:Uncharacterized protein n=1 Tax=Planosporangium thailandense TaxID=765197 RepID=A0ABX0XX88_9ACTN|nr:hypothetical protein [Planosporangium thailandense]NJC69897.1 hypothetical protein [Planosporangium thailandense]